MSITFLEPGGDATFNVNAVTSSGLWRSKVGAGTVLATDFVHGGHIKSINTGSGGAVLAPFGLTSAQKNWSGRLSVWIYLVAYGGSTKSLFDIRNGADSIVYQVTISTAGAISALPGGGSAGTLTTGAWHHVCLAYSVTDFTVNTFKIFIDGELALTTTNTTLSNIDPQSFRLNNGNATTPIDVRWSDIYHDNDTSLNNTGPIWVTAKRPVSNGTANNFNVQIGSGGSGYGSGHTPQVNERPVSSTNGWSVVALGATTEEYTIEAADVGDINISTAMLIGYMGWVYADSLIAETAQIVVAGVSSDISIGDAVTFVFMKVATTSPTPTYPAGGTDIGMISSATATTVKLYDCGIIVAYMPFPSTGPTPLHHWTLLPQI